MSLGTKFWITLLWIWCAVGFSFVAGFYWADSAGYQRVGLVLVVFVFMRNAISGLVHFLRKTRREYLR